MLFLAAKSAYSEHQRLWSQSCLNNAYLLGCLSFIWQKCVSLNHCRNCPGFLLLHMVFYWTSSEIDLAQVHISVLSLASMRKFTTACFLRQRCISCNLCTVSVCLSI